MLIELLVGLGTIGAIELSRANKSMKIDEQTMQKNVRAFTKTAEAQSKLEKYQEITFNTLCINAKRKHALLTCHFKMFEEQYSIIRKIQFKKGRGIEELEKIDEIQNKITHYIQLPTIASGKVLTDSQLLVSFAMNGIGRMMVKDSKANLQLASKNVSQANAVSAQIDSICIALDGIKKHTEIITDLLEKLGMLYIKSIKNISEILKTNGLEESNYSVEDVQAINICLSMTKLLYRIINTPLIDAEGAIEKESLKVIQDGQQLLKSIQDRDN